MNKLIGNAVVGQSGGPTSAINATLAGVIKGAAAANGDEAAKEILEQVYEILGRFLASIACVADPEVIVLGGGVSKAGQPLIDGATRYFHKYAFHACRSTRIALATLGNDAGAYGAFKLALDAFN